MGACLHSKRAEGIDENMTDVDNSTANTQITKNDSFEKEKNPRVIFVSFFKLSQQWSDIPVDILMDSIIVINGCRQQMFPKTFDDMRISVDWTLSKLDFTPHFSDFIQCKDAQGSVIWMSPNEPTKPDRGTIAAASNSVFSDANEESKAMDGTAIIDDKKVWSKVEFMTQQLGSMIDPFTNQLYSQSHITNLNFSDATNACDGNFRGLMQLFKTLNSNLIPMITFDKSLYETEHNRIKANAIVSKETSKIDGCVSNHSKCDDIADSDGFALFNYDSYANK